MWRNLGLFSILLQGLLWQALMGSFALAKGKPSASLKEGMQHYTKGEFKAAIPSFQKALSQASHKEDKSRIYKYLGLSQYTLGQKSAAEESFLLCLKVDSACSIKKDEALDESVLPFFAATKDKLSKHDSKSDTKTETKPEAKIATRILIESNAEGAEVLIDGIMAGSAGAFITAPPGTIEVEIHAKGYKPRKLKIVVVKNKENKYQIDLEKLPVGPSKEELAARAAKEKARKQAELAAREKSKAASAGKKQDEERMQKAKGEGGDDLFGFAEEEKKEKELEKSPKKFDESFVSDGKTPGINEKLVDILEDDKGPKAPKKDKSEAKATSPQSPAIPAPPPLASPISLLHFMPLGLGQIKNGDYILAALVAGTQAYGALMYLDAMQAEQNARDNYLMALQQAKIDPGITPQDLIDLQNRSSNYIAKQQQAQTTYGLIVLSSYGFSVLQGILMRPDLPSISAKTSQATEPDRGVQWSLFAGSREQVGLSLGISF